jgi:hypothetical protein
MQSKWLVSLDKMATAERVFMAALNLDPRQFYRRGMTFNDKGFTALSAVKPDDAPDDGWVTVGEGDHEEKAWPVTFEVID